MIVLLIGSVEFDTWRHDGKLSGILQYCKVETFPLLVIRLNFQKVKGLFLTENITRFIGTRPIRNSQLRARAFGSEDPPMIGDTDRYLGLRIGGIDLVE